MSNTFDTMQAAILWLAGDKNEDHQRTAQAARYMRQIIHKLHNLHHGADDIPRALLNQVAGREVALLAIVLTEKDPETRALRLEARMEA